MRFAGPLGLGDFIEALPLDTLLCVFAVYLLAKGLYGWKHGAIGKVAVVGDSQQAAAGLLLVGCHPVP